MGYKKITKKGEDFMYSIAEKNGYDGLIKGKNNYEIPFINDPNKRNMILEANIFDDDGNLITNNKTYIEYIIKKYNYYGKLYDLDANILSAQAFVESGFKVWNYAKYPSSAFGLSQFSILTLFDVAINNRPIAKPNFTDSEIEKLIKNITNPFDKTSYLIGNKEYLDSNSSNFNRLYDARENRYNLLLNGINNPDLMIKAQCKYVKFIANRNFNLASNTLFAYNRGSSYKSDTYVDIINKVRKDKGNDYIKEGVKYVEKIFGVLADRYNEVTIIKPINKWFGYKLDMNKNNFNGYNANIPIFNSLNNQNILFILDRAHGKDVQDRIIDGFEEWKYSDRVVNRLANKLDFAEIPYMKNVPEDYEIGLSERVFRANTYSSKVLKPILISFHNNAGGGSGNELYLPINPTFEEIKIGNIFAQNIKNGFPNIMWRKERVDKLYKEGNYTILNGTNEIIPKYNGLLIEFLFMDNINDRKLLEDDNILNKYVEILYNSILDVINYYGFDKY